MSNRILEKWVKAAEVNCSVPHFSVGETWIFFEAQHRSISGAFEHWNPKTFRNKSLKTYLRNGSLIEINKRMMTNKGCAI